VRRLCSFQREPCHRPSCRLFRTLDCVWTSSSISTRASNLPPGALWLSLRVIRSPSPRSLGPSMWAREGLFPCRWSMASSRPSGTCPPAPSFPSASPRSGRRTPRRAGSSASGSGTRDNGRPPRRGGKRPSSSPSRIQLDASLAGSDRLDRGSQQVDGRSAGHRRSARPRVPPGWSSMNPAITPTGGQVPPWRNMRAPVSPGPLAFHRRLSLQSLGVPPVSPDSPAGVGLSASCMACFSWLIGDKCPGAE
jgi:hypothetical protein